MLSTAGAHSTLGGDFSTPHHNQISLTDPHSRAMAAHTKARRRLQHPARRRREEQADRRAGGDQPGRRHGAFDGDGKTGTRDLDVDTIDVVADRGDFKAADTEACERAGCIPHVPRPQRGSSVREGFFRKDEFRYDRARRLCLPSREVADPDPPWPAARSWQGRLR